MKLEVTLKNYFMVCILGALSTSFVLLGLAGCDDRPYVEDLHQAPVLAPAPIPSNSSDPRLALPASQLPEVPRAAELESWQAFAPFIYQLANEQSDADEKIFSFQFLKSQWLAFEPNTERPKARTTSTMNRLVLFLVHNSEFRLFNIEAPLKKGETPDSEALEKNARMTNVLRGFWFTKTDEKGKRTRLYLTTSATPNAQPFADLTLIDPISSQAARSALLSLGELSSLGKFANRSVIIEVTSDASGLITYEQKWRMKDSK